MMNVWYDLSWMGNISYCLVDVYRRSGLCLELYGRSGLCLELCASWFGADVAKELVGDQTSMARCRLEKCCERLAFVKSGVVNSCCELCVLVRFLQYNVTTTPVLPNLKKCADSCIAYFITHFRVLRRCTWCSVFIGRMSAAQVK
jgi:hypothetical protein